MKLQPLGKGEWKLVGHFGVAAGLCWIGDPCYILHSADSPQPSLGRDWTDFCNKLGDDFPTIKSFPYLLGSEGLGICVSTGMGDGTYPVYAFILEDGQWGKQVAAVFIDFYDFISEAE